MKQAYLFEENEFKIFLTYIKENPLTDLSADELIGSLDPIEDLYSESDN